MNVLPWSCDGKGTLVCCRPSLATARTPLYTPHPTRHSPQALLFPAPLRHQNVPGHQKHSFSHKGPCHTHPSPPPLTSPDLPRATSFLPCRPNPPTLSPTQPILKETNKKNETAPRPVPPARRHACLCAAHAQAAHHQTDDAGLRRYVCVPSHPPTHPPHPA